MTRWPKLPRTNRNQKKYLAQVIAARLAFPVVQQVAPAVTWTPRTWESDPPSPLTIYVLQPEDHPQLTYLNWDWPILSLVVDDCNHAAWETALKIQREIQRCLAAARKKDQASREKAAKFQDQAVQHTARLREIETHIASIANLTFNDRTAMSLEPDFKRWRNGNLLGSQVADAIEKLLDIDDDSEYEEPCYYDENDEGEEQDDNNPLKKTEFLKAIRKPETLEQIRYALWSLHPFERKYVAQAMTERVSRDKQHTPQDLQLIQESAQQFVPYEQRFDIRQILRHIRD